MENKDKNIFHLLILYSENKKWKKKKYTCKRGKKCWEERKEEKEKYF